MSDDAAPWRPLSRQSDPTYDALIDTAPGWLMPSLLAWVRPVFEWQDDRGHPQRDSAKLHELERRLRVELDWSVDFHSALPSLEAGMTNDRGKTLALDVVDLIASWHTESWERAKLRVLDEILAEAGSVWTVSTQGGRPGLVRRVDATVAAGAERVMDESGRSGELLAKAWRAAYGRSPDPSAAYTYAVRAVEAAAQPVVSPKNASATLGTMIRDLEAAPTKWGLSLTPRAGFDRVGALIGMMKLLWKSQLDRHGTADESVPLSVSPEEAEVALHLAVTLVHWFTKAGVTRVGADAEASATGANGKKRAHP